jgi:hypothetical protein
MRSRCEAPVSTASSTRSYFKLEDVAPDGTVTLPGIAHEFPAGDRIALVIAGSDSSYSLASPDISVSMTGAGQLDLPVTGSGSYGPLADTAKR